jgi:Family of unknown function (DUF6156)
MNHEQHIPTRSMGTSRYFVSYSGIKLPLKLVNEITEASLNNRNTYYRGYFDAQDRILLCQKVVYGELKYIHVAVMSGNDKAVARPRLSSLQGYRLSYCMHGP